MKTFRFVLSTMLFHSFVFFLLIVGSFGGRSPNADKLKEQGVKEIPEDALLDTTGLLDKYGYPSETHEVETEDGYVVTVHRITGGKGKASQKADKPVVLLVHGLMCSSADWINAGPENGFGYYLVEQGYDVWMTNARGNYYSRKHTTLDPDTDSKYWKFSWNEIGYYDLPATIDRILAVTGQEKVHYVGHSQGTTVFFVMASLRPEYNNKIKSMQAMAPVVYMSHLRSPFMNLMARYMDTLEIVIALIGYNEMAPNREMTALLGDKVCSDEAKLQSVCTNFLFMMCGSSDVLNTTLLPVILGHVPAGAAMRQHVHYGQEINSGFFRKYDFGSVLNLIEYGSTSPPKYPLEKVTAPVALHYADNDLMVEEIDVLQLYAEISNPIGLFRIPHTKFNHLDYLWGMNIKSLLYDRVIELMRQYD